ncbi:MAG: hypothetical protein R3Y13_02485 [bacterium]
MKYSYSDLLNIEYKKYISLIIFIVLFIIFIYFTFVTYAYSSNELKGVYDGEYIVLAYDVDVLDIKEDEIFLEIYNKKYFFEIVYFDDVYLYGDKHYQNVYISVDESFILNEVIDLTFFYSRERIIKKITNLFF